MAALTTARTADRHGYFSDYHKSVFLHDARPHPRGALAATCLLTEADFERRLAAFDADDSGAMQHVIADDPHETFLVAFGALVAMPRPVTAAQLAT